MTSIPLPLGLRLKIALAMPDLDQIKAALLRSGRPSSDFDLNKDGRSDHAMALREAGVLVALIAGKNGLDVILTKRSSALKHHPGQIAFAGGKKDACDPTVIETALREAREEIGLPSEVVQVLGTLPAHETVTGFNVTPVVAFVQDEFTVQPEPGEVAEVFRVPVAHVLMQDNFRVQSRRWRGRSRAYYAVPFGPYYIWGATARILWAWSDQMK